MSLILGSSDVSLWLDSSYSLEAEIPQWVTTEDTRCLPIPLLTVSSSLELWIRTREVDYQDTNDSAACQVSSAQWRKRNILNSDPPTLAHLQWSTVVFSWSWVSWRRAILEASQAASDREGLCVRPGVGVTSSEGSNLVGWCATLFLLFSGSNPGS